MKSPNRVRRNATPDRPKTQARKRPCNPGKSINPGGVNCVIELTPGELARLDRACKHLRCTREKFILDAAQASVTALLEDSFTLASLNARAAAGKKGGAK